MALPKEPIDISFAEGLDTKTDPKRLSIGRFLILENSVFGETGALVKRFGFDNIAPLDNTFSKLSTFNDNLLGIGDSLAAYSAGANVWVDKGAIRPLSLSVLPLVRTNTNQTQADSVVASNGLVCTVYTDNIPMNGTSTPSYKYVIADSRTGQNIVNPTVITPVSGTVEGAPRVWAVGGYFVIIFINLISSTYHLSYIAIRINNPTDATASVSLTAQFNPSTYGLAFDGIVANNNLYFAWNGSDIGGAIRVSFINSTLGQGNTVAFAGQVADNIAVVADTSRNTPVIYVNAYKQASNLIKTLVVDNALNTITNPTTTVTSVSILNLTGVALNGVQTLFYEVINSYGYDSSLPTDYIRKVSIQENGSAGSPATVIRSVGLASKAFTVNSINYFLSLYLSEAQPTYFLHDEDGNEICKIAYQNGSSSYYRNGLPGVSLTDNIVSIPYLFRDQVLPVNKSQNATNALGVYAQTGINLATMEIGRVSMSTSEIAKNLHMSGGFLWMYDGFEPVEHGFHLYPDNVELEALADLTPTGDTSNGSPTISNVSNMTNITVGMTITGTDIPANTTIIAIDPDNNEITMSANSVGTHVANSLTLSGDVAAQQYFYQVIYEWSDAQGNIFRSAPSIPVTITPSSESIIKLSIPTLRLTYKLTNPVKIVIFRWSTAQQVYYQVTSLLSPLLNNENIDYVEYVDVSSDTDIIGNSIIYTTGGVLENIGAPACNVTVLFDNRLFLIPSENENILEFSKQVIENVPVEISDLLTMFINPTTGVQKGTGPTRAGAQMDDKLVLFKRDAIYYITGKGPDNTGANNQYSDPIFINSTVGCSNPDSVILTPVGVMFQSNQGIWLLGRDLSTKYIGAPVQEFNNDAVVSVVAVPGTNQIRFNLASGTVLVYNYFYDQWATFTGVAGISSTIYNDIHSFINSDGKVFVQNNESYTDGGRPVLMRFKTGWINLAGLQGFQRAYALYLLGQYFSPHQFALKISYDYNSSPTQITTVTPDNFNLNYGEEQLWGSGAGEEGTYGGTTDREQWRIFLQTQKCEALQIEFNEMFDPSFGTVPGQGLNLSSLMLLVSKKKGYFPIKASNSAG